MTGLCICGSNKTKSKCCERFLSGKQHAVTPEQLMRSRYSAYALGGYGEYLLKTWFPATAQGLTAEQLSERTLDWQELEVLSKSQKGDEGQVVFRAKYFCENGKEGVMSEVSSFKRVKGHWYYVGGEVEAG